MDDRNPTQMEGNAAKIVTYTYRMRKQQIDSDINPSVPQLHS